MTEQLIRRNLLRANALGVAVGEKLIDHVPIRLQAVLPGIGLKNLFFFIQIMIRPSLNQTGNLPSPLLCPVFGT